jgi:colanic acid biosynthesis protein WcaH
MTAHFHCDPDGRLPYRTWARMCELCPIIRIELLIKNKLNKILLVKRVNQPMSGQLWLPGGRLLKDELLFNAINRIAKREVGLIITDVRLSHFEERFDNDIHQICFVYSCKCVNDEVNLDSTCVSYIWYDGVGQKLDDRLLKYILI